MHNHDLESAIDLEYKSESISKIDLYRHQPHLLMLGHIFHSIIKRKLEKGRGGIEKQFPAKTGDVHQLVL